MAGREMPRTGDVKGNRQTEQRHLFGQESLLLHMENFITAHVSFRSQGEFQHIMTLYRSWTL